MANTSKLSCALVQADTRWADPTANRDNLARLMDSAPDCGLYVLPETCNTGFLGDSDLDESGRRHEICDGREVAWLESQAGERGAAIACSIVVEENEKLFNRFVLAQPGTESAFYDKRHLFGFGGEGRRYTAGNKRVRAEFAGKRVDLQVCYDLRFPVWCRNDDAFDLQIFVANWPAPRAEAWRTLLKARAIENQAFVIGLNRAGVDGKNVEYPGSSGAWDALGEALVGPLDEREQVATCELDFEALDEVRKKFPFLPDRDGFSIEP
ncbi:MAG: nitrilase-related carbon-nitrogen hydrolase [Wenzhouxiangellaceae bacterium]